MKIRKDDFFTIPCAPNYEINGYFDIRNKKTGLFLKLAKKKGRKPCQITLSHNNKPIIRSVENLYKMAVSATKKFYPIKSLENLYETDHWGNVRNAKTKNFLKPYLLSGRTYYHFTINKKGIVLSKNQVLLEVFGVTFKLKHKKIPVQLSKERLAWRFNSINEAAKFLAPKLFFSTRHIAGFFYQRQPEVFGYKVTYLG